MSSLGLKGGISLKPLCHSTSFTDIFHPLRHRTTVLRKEESITRKQKPSNMKLKLNLNLAMVQLRKYVPRPRYVPVDSKRPEASGPSKYESSPYNKCIQRNEKPHNRDRTICLVCHSNRSRSAQTSCPSANPLRSNQFRANSCYSQNGTQQPPIRYIPTIPPLTSYSQNPQPNHHHH